MSKTPLVVNEAYIQALVQMVLDAPFPQLVGMRLDAIGIDSATILLDLDRRHQQPFGVVHGGVLATLIDTATFWAAFLRLPEDAGLVNIDLKLNYLQPAGAGRLTAVGHCLRPGRTLSYTEAHVYDEQGDLLAHGTSTLMTLPGRRFNFDVAKFVNP
jgi:uncharacterized protein (TIGR00369 family)